MRPVSVSPVSIVTLILTSLLGVAVACCSNAGEKPRRHWPKPTPPPPPSPIYTPSREHAWTEQEIEQIAREHNARLEAEIERALHSKKPGHREAVFTFLLPELLQVEPSRVVAMVARQKPGEARDTLITEVTRQWIGQDPDAAIGWIKTLSEEDRRLSEAAVTDDPIVAQNPDAISALDQLKASLN
jgi:hypothetical protein